MQPQQSVWILSMIMAMSSLACGESLSSEPEDEAPETVTQELRHSPPAHQLSQQLLSSLASHGGPQAFKLPESYDFNRIPQDPNNRLNFRQGSSR